MRLSLILSILVMLPACQSRRIDACSLAPAPKMRPVSAYRDSVHYSRDVIDPLVKNGDCYERFVISLPIEIKTVVLPTDSTTFKTRERRVEGYVIKALYWGGHPSEPGTSIDSERSLMGVAIERTPRRLRVTGFGAWHSFEGGSSIKLAVGVPDGVRVKFSDKPPDNFTADKLTAEGWFVIDTEPTTKEKFPIQFPHD